MKKKFFRLRILHGIILINAIFLVLSGTIILSSLWISSEKNAWELSNALAGEIKNSVAGETMNYFSPARAVNQSLTFLLYGYFTDPINNGENRERLFGYYRETMKAYPQFKMLYYADTAGDLVMLNRMDDGTFSVRSVHNAGDLIHTQWDHANPSYYGTHPNTTLPEKDGYDPRERLWYKSAEEERTTIWTPVYLFATDHLPGFTCSAPIFDSAGNVIGVSSIDIAVNELSRFLGTLHPTPGTKIFIIDRENKLVALQAETEKDFENLFIEGVDAQGNLTHDITSVPEIKDEEIRFLLNQSSQDGGLITYNGKRYIDSRMPLTIGGGLELIISVIIPEDDIVGNVRNNIRKVIIFSIFILLIVLVANAFFSRAIAKPIRGLSEEMSKIKSFDLDSSAFINSSLIEITDIRDSFENMRGGLKSFKRYVPADLVAQLINQSITPDLGGEEQELTVFFSDIAKFTSIAEKLTPKMLVADLCVYFEIISKTIIENKGTIDKYIGDSIMAFWGAPAKLQHHASSACNSAIQIRNSLYTLFRQWENQGKLPFTTRIGIHTGNVIVGNIGYHERLNYTVIGDTVNVSSRLEGTNKIYGTDIIISQSTYEQCRDEFEFRLLDRISVLGRKQEMNIYELITFKDDIGKNQRKLYQYYEYGLQAYFDKKWDEGLKYFNYVLKYRPNDIPSKLMRERCLLYQKNPPSGEWNGVFAQPYK